MSVYTLINLSPWRYLHFWIWNEVCRSNRGSAIQLERVGKYQPYPVRTFSIIGFSLFARYFWLNLTFPMMVFYPACYCPDPIITIFHFPSFLLGLSHLNISGRGRGNPENIGKATQHYTTSIPSAINYKLDTVLITFFPSPRPDVFKWDSPWSVPLSLVTSNVSIINQTNYMSILRDDIIIWRKFSIFPSPVSGWGYKIGPVCVSVS